VADYIRCELFLLLRKQNVIIFVVADRLINVNQIDIKC